jgi:hypothetical protein
VLFQHGHHLDGVDQVVGRRRDAMGVHAAEDARQPVAQAGGLLQLALQEVQALADRREGVRDAAVERGADLRQAEPEAAQRHDPRQPPHVAGAVAPVPGRRALGRHEQARPRRSGAARGP